jgi:Exostosin family
VITFSRQSLPPPGRIGLYSPAISHLPETAARWMADSPEHEVVVLHDDREFTRDEEHYWCARRMAAHPRIRIQPVSSIPEKTGTLVIHLASHLRTDPPGLSAWAEQANEVCLLSTRIFGFNPRAWVYDLRCAGRYARRAGRVWLLQAPGGVHPYFWLRRDRFSPYVHPQLLCGEAAHAAFASQWQAAEQPGERRWRIAYIGNRQPKPRADILSAIEPVVRGQRVFWHDYGTGGKNAQGLEPAAYLSALAQSDFCLCPPGWSDWTHRTVEASALRCIPIVSEPQHYNLGFVDGVNCVAVKRGDWVEAVRRALAVSATDLAVLRQGLDLIRTERLGHFSPLSPR